MIEVVIVDVEVLSVSVLVLFMNYESIYVSIINVEDVVVRKKCI